MNFKFTLVAAFMASMSLISCPAYSATDTQKSETPTTTQTIETTKKTALKNPHHTHKNTQKKIQPHQAVHYTPVIPEEHPRVIIQTDDDAMDSFERRHILPVHDYREMSMEIPRIDNYTIMYDEMSQNFGRAKAMPDWFNRIGISGGINADGHWGNRSMGYMGENIRRLALNDAYLNFSAIVNDCAKAFMSLSYQNTGAELFNSPEEAESGGVSADFPKPGVYNSNHERNSLVMEQAYITLANYDCLPVFFQIGKQFTDFGRYMIHPLTRTMAQVLSESLQTSAKLGFITQLGFHGNIYAFDNQMTKSGHAHTKTIYGFALGYDHMNDELGYDMGVGYMTNMLGVNDVNEAVGTFTGTGDHGNYIHSVGAASIYGDINSGPFFIGARFVTATSRFSRADMSTKYLDTDANGARPWAGDLVSGYGFNCWGKNQDIYVGYQRSHDAVNVFLPKHRYVLGYGIDVVRNTNVNLEIDHDQDYNAKHGGTGETSNLFGARIGVKFG